jgi:hypothetical protein
MAGTVVEAEAADLLLLPAQPHQQTRQQHQPPPLQLHPVKVLQQSLRPQQLLVSTSHCLRMPVLSQSLPYLASILCDIPVSCRI